ncbi:MAG: DUF882 domain-containing protein [Rhodospirillaceae bacterium]|nr:DUF882 domain-containing protein [Rhodospirillaceae bacterium]
MSAPVPAWARLPKPAEKRLRFDNLHTGERCTVTFWANGDYVWEGLREINHVLRDFRTGEVYPIDVKLLELLHALDGRLGGGRRFAVISGYRSPKTNAMLAALDGSGVAKNSLHMSGRAIDIRVDGLALTDLRQTAIALGRGGVGFYPRSDFVHVDIGPVRVW